MTALTFVAAAALTTTASGTSAPSPAFALTAGQHVLAYIKWDGADTPVTLADTAGNAYTALARTHNATVGGQWFYSLSAAANAANVVTATFGAARVNRTVRVLVVSGVAPTGITQYAATTTNGTQVRVSVAVPEISVGAMVLAGSSSSASDEPRITTIGNVTCPEVGALSSLSSTAYREFAAGAGGPLDVAFTGSATVSDRVLLALYLDNGILPSASRTTLQASKLNNYSVLGAVPDQSTVSKIGAYSILGSVPDQASFSKLSGYAVVYENSVSNAKFNTYAVLGGPDNAASSTKTTSYAVLGGADNGVSNDKTISYAVLGGPDNAGSNTKTIAYAVLGAGDAFQTASKTVAYAVLEYSSAVSRPQVFTCT